MHILPIQVLARWGPGDRHIAVEATLGTAAHSAQRTAYSTRGPRSRPTLSALPFCHFSASSASGLLLPASCLSAAGQLRILTRQKGDKTRKPYRATPQSEDFHTEDATRRIPPGSKPQSFFAPARSCFSFFFSLFFNFALFSWLRYFRPGVAARLPPAACARSWHIQKKT